MEETYLKFRNGWCFGDVDVIIGHGKVEITITLPNIEPKGLFC